MTYDAAHLRRVAVGLTRRVLRRRGLRPRQVETLTEDLAHTAIANAMEKWDPERTDKGPIVLIRWAVFDAVREHFAPPDEDAGVHIPTLYGEGADLRLDGEGIDEEAA